VKDVSLMLKSTEELKMWITQHIEEVDEGMLSRIWIEIYH